MSTTASINTPERAGLSVVLLLAASTKIFAGNLVALNSSGYAVNAANTAGLEVIGRAEESVDNSAGSAGDLPITVKRGVFCYANSGTNALATAHLFKRAYVEDEATVGSTGSNKVVAGLVVDIDSEGVWIDTRYQADRVPSADTLTALTFSSTPTQAEVQAFRAAVLALLQAQALVR